MPLSPPRWTPETQARLIRIAAVMVFLLIALWAALTVLRVQAMMHPPKIDRHHMFEPVHWGPLTLPSRAWQTAWGVWLINLFTPACYCLALWSSGRMFEAAGKDSFSPALARGLKHVGLWLIAGGVPALISIPFGAWIFFAANGKRLHVVGSILASLEFQMSKYAAGLVLCLIGLVLLKAAAGGQRLRGRLDEFV